MNSPIIAGSSHLSAIFTLVHDNFIPVRHANKVVLRQHLNNALRPSVLFWIRAQLHVLHSSVQSNFDMYEFLAMICEHISKVLNFSYVFSHAMLFDYVELG